MVPWKNEIKRRKKTLKKINKKNHLTSTSTLFLIDQKKEMKWKKRKYLKKYKKELNSTSGLLLINQEITIKIETKA